MTSKSSGKKTATKKKVSKSQGKPSTTKTSNKTGIVYNEKIFIENFINLQHAMTNLTIKFGELSLNISKLLNIFEESAKALAKSEKQVDGQVVNKIDSLLEQNKTIAKGLVLMEDQFKRQSRFTSPATNPNPFEGQKQNTQTRPIPSQQVRLPNDNSQQGADRPKPLPQL